MKRKILVFTAVIGIAFFGLFNSINVSAFTGSYNVYFKRIDLGANGWFFVGEQNVSALSFIVGTFLEVPGIDKKYSDIQDLVDLYSRQGLNLQKGEPINMSRNQYYKVMETSNPDRLELRININKEHLWEWCEDNNYDCNGKVPDSPTVKLYMLRYFHAFYILDEDLDTGLGYNKGYNDGYYKGYDEGYREAYDEAYNKGYRQGKNEAVMEELDLFGYLQALFGEQGLGRLLRLELLPGVSLGAVIMIPMAFFLVSFIMRWFR